eukprot:1135690-Pyramimonas_sp.AAC.2
MASAGRASQEGHRRTWGLPLAGVIWGRGRGDREREVWRCGWWRAGTGQALGNGEGRRRRVA